MIFSRNTILKAIKNGDISITPFGETSLKEASYSFHISKEITLGPGEFIVLSTLERVCLGDNVALMLSTRGSIAQRGVDVLQSSTFCEPGTDDHLKLEIKNNSNDKVNLTTAMPIVKGIFFSVK